MPSLRIKDLASLGAPQTLYCHDFETKVQARGGPRQGNRMNIFIDRAGSRFDSHCWLGIFVPEGRVENSPGWSAAEPWDGFDEKIARPVGVRRTFCTAGIEFHAIARGAAETGD